MVTEIVEVLAKITEMMQKEPNQDTIVETISRDSNYNKNVVAAAYSWIYEKLDRNKNFRNSQKSKESLSVRTLSTDEALQIGLKNYNYLLHFYNIGLLTTSDLETIIDDLKLFPEGTVNEEQINLLILSLFLDMDNLTLPGSRLLLYSSDTIN